MSAPYLSIVASSRNDNHGGDMTKRMRLFVNGLLHQTRKYKVAVELIIVEWNPPAGRGLLHEVLPKPQSHDKLTIRYIVVPNTLHQQYRFADVLPLYQMIGKNVGIRRAKGKFVLCTNVDLLFSNDLFAFFEQQQLDENSFYRANRCDIPNTIEENWSFDKQHAFAEENIMERLGFAPNKTILLAPVLEKNALVASIVRKLVRIKRYFFNTPSSVQLWQLDTNACGDFTLMSKAAWEDIQGYPELDLYSIHIDSMGVIAALALGYEQVILPPTACTYHIYHKTGWGSMNDLEKVHFWHKRPGIGWDAVHNAGKYLLANKVRYDINAPNWGFADVDLQEICLTP